MPLAKCPRCFKGGYAKERSEADKRPLFRCNHCGHIWTCGLDGGEYLTKAEKAAFTAKPTEPLETPNGH